MTTQKEKEVTAFQMLRAFAGILVYIGTCILLARVGWDIGQLLHQREKVAALEAEVRALRAGAPVVITNGGRK